MNLSGGSGGTGLGTISFDIEPAGGASGSVFGSFHSFFDLEIDEMTTTFFNEYGDVGLLGNGFNPNRWEIDEPGFVFGDIDLNFEYGVLDNTNAVPSSSPDDVAVALGWDDFELQEEQNATLTLVASDSGLTVADEVMGINPSEVFTLQHIDPNSGATITFSGALEINGAPPTPPSDVIPEPSTFILLGCGIFTFPRI